MARSFNKGVPRHNARAVAKRKSKKARAGSGVAPTASDAGARLSKVVLAIALAATALVVDSGADASFDAPKRLIGLFAIAAAAAFAFTRPVPGWSGLRIFREGSPARRLALFFLLAAVGAALLSAVLSPRRPPALDAARTVLLFGLLLPLGASRVLERPNLLLGVFLAGAAMNAAVSLLQASGRFQPFALKTSGNREAIGAFVGNVGYLALLLAIAAVMALAIALTARSRPLRTAAGALALLSLAGILVNQNFTAVLALAAGALVLMGGSYGRRALLPAAAAAVLVAAGVATYAPLRARAVQAAAAARAGEWDRLLTYRVGPWSAAMEMIRERPLLGFGPGTFGSEFVPHRLKAEIRYRERFVNPLVTSSYAEAHSDYLQAFAEGGGIAGSAAVAAALLLLIATSTAARRAEGARRAEAVALMAILTAGATAALTWFPLQRPVTAIPLLLAAGRAWRISGETAAARPPLTLGGEGEGRRPPLALRKRRRPPRDATGRQGRVEEAQ